MPVDPRDTDGFRQDAVPFIAAVTLRNADISSRPNTGVSKKIEATKITAIPMSFTTIPALIRSAIFTLSFDSTMAFGGVAGTEAVYSREHGSRGEPTYRQHEGERNRDARGHDQVSWMHASDHCLANDCNRNCRIR